MTQHKSNLHCVKIFKKIEKGYNNNRYRLTRSQHEEKQNHFLHKKAVFVSILHITASIYINLAIKLGTIATIQRFNYLKWKYIVCQFSSLIMIDVHVTWRGRMCMPRLCFWRRGTNLCTKHCLSSMWHRGEPKGKNNKTNKLWISNRYMNSGDSLE